MQNAYEIVEGLKEFQSMRSENQCYACMGNVLEKSKITFIDDLINEAIEVIEWQQKRNTWLETEIQGLLKNKEGNMP